MEAALTERWVIAAWVRSVEDEKAGTFQFVGKRHFWNGLKTSMPESSPSLASQSYRMPSAKGPT